MAFAHTFSIVARCSLTGDLGVAVQSHWFAVGAIVPWVQAGVGAVATQSLVEPAYGPNGLSAMTGGEPADKALALLIAADSARDVRQVGMIDAKGCTAAWTGPRCVAAAGHHIGNGFTVQANMMTSEAVWPAMAVAFETTTGDLADRMLASLDAAQAAGGDARGKQSAALIVVRAKSTGKPWLDRLFDLRVDDAIEPLIELRRLVRLQRAYNHMNAGDVAMEQGDTAAALIAYGEAQSLVPNSAEMLFWHAVAMANVGKTDEARVLLGKCYQMDSRWTAMTPRVIAAGLMNMPFGDA